MKYFSFCYNTTPHTSFEFNYTPFELTFGRSVNRLDCIEDNTGKIDPIYNIDDYSKELKFRLQTAHKRANELLQKTKQLIKQTYDKHSNPIKIKINDKILLVDETRHKLDPIYKGPFIITQIIEPNVEILDINSNKRKTVHKNQIRKYIN